MSTRDCTCICRADVMHAKARLFVATGTHVQPHSSDGLEGLDAHFRWVKVKKETFEYVDLADDADTLGGFCKQFNCDVQTEAMLVAIHIAVRPAYSLSVVYIQSPHIACNPCICSCVGRSCDVRRLPVCIALACMYH